MSNLAKLCAIAGLLAGSVMAYGQAQPITGSIVNQYGIPTAGVVRVCSVTSTGNPCTPTTPIYYDYGLTLQAPNPIATDSAGNYAFYVPAIAAPNVYVVQLSPNNGQPFSYLYNGPYCSITGCTFTGGITAPYFNATSSPYFEVNGSQLASTNLADTANIAYIANQNVFTGNEQTAPIWNATTSFDVNGTPIACTNLSDCSNLAKLNASNTFTGSLQTVVGLTASGTVKGAIVNAVTGYQFNGTAASNHVLLGNGTDYVDSATIPYSIISGSPTLYYQTVQVAGSSETQEPKLNFVSGVTCVDNSGTTSTNCTVSASASRIIFVTSLVLSAPGTYYIAYQSVVVTTESELSGFLMPLAGTAGKLNVGLDFDPGSGVTVAVVLRDNGSNTSVTCTITGNGSTNKSCSDLTHTAAIAAGDVADFSVLVTGDPAETLLMSIGTSY